MHKSPVAIIGTGIAGLSAAHALRQAGCAVVLFEKSRGSGGRLASKRTAIGPVDIGAPCFSATGSDFRHACQQWHDDGLIAAWPPSVGAAGWTGVPRMSSLSRGLLADTTVHFGCRINDILPMDSQWQLVDSEGTRHGPFASVILAVPAPQASELLSTAPALASLAASVEMRPIWSVALGFRHPLPAPAGPGSPASYPLARHTHNSAKPDRANAMDVWVLQADSDWSAANLDTPGAEIATQLQEAFARTLDYQLPPADFTLAHRWLYAEPAQPRSWSALAEASMGLYVCGDWCLAGRIEDAWLSGREAARLLLEYNTTPGSNN
ncbi:MAG: FAD-dependent oxidoreductase [Pseudomonas sp.]